MISIKILPVLSSCLLLLNLAHLLGANQLFPVGTVIEGKRAVFLSEIQLRNLIVNLNKELTNLKRDFVKDVTENYLKIKQDPDNGFKRAKMGHTFGIAMALMGEEFADMLIKRHIIQRRSSSGLKVLYHKLLPLNTLKLLSERYPKTYSWLKNLEQIDLRPSFPGIKDNEYIQLYQLINVRARMRANDDIIALTDNNMKRIFKLIKWFLIDEQGKDIKPEELESMSAYAKKLLTFYLREILDNGESIKSEFIERLQASENLKNSIGKNEEQFLTFIDQLINQEGLDIDLSREANTMQLPPTINEAMIDNIRPKWIPSELLNSITNDRKSLLKAKMSLKNLVKIDEEHDVDDVDSSEWCQKVLYYLGQQHFDN